MALSIAAWTARRLTYAQRDAVRALADGRIHPITAPTMSALIRLELVEAVNGAPVLTELGLDVAADLPAGQ